MPFGDAVYLAMSTLIGVLTRRLTTSISAWMRRQVSYIRTRCMKNFTSSLAEKASFTISRQYFYGRRSVSCQEAEHITKKNIVWAEVRTFVRLFGCCSTNGRLQPACRYVLHTVGPIVRNIPHKCSQIVPVEASETKAAALCGYSRIVVISIPCSAFHLLDIYITASIVTEGLETSWLITCHLFLFSLCA